MLPNLARLDLRHEEEVVTGSPNALDLTAQEPPLPQATPDEVDNSSNDSLLKGGLVKDPEESQTFKTNRALIAKWFPFDTASTLKEKWLNLMFNDILFWDEPPNRHLFSALGGFPRSIRHMRLNEHSNLVMGMTAISTNAFVALRSLRKRFANKPKYYNSVEGCGSSNCHESGVEVFGGEDWQLALQAIMVAIDQGENHWQGGRNLPKTVAIRAPKESLTHVDFFDEVTMDNREELWLTLRAAHLGISPPVFATFPVKILSARNVLAERGYGYVFEDGWLDLRKLIEGLQSHHKTSDELDQAKRNLERSVTLLLHKVSDNDLLLVDIKLPNMVGRRVGNTLAYEVRMIDFGPMFTANVNMGNEQKTTSAACIFFVNGLLLLNYISTWSKSMVPIFCGLATEVFTTWRTMTEQGDSFCTTLRADEKRVEGKDMQSLRSLIREPKGGFPALLRFAFYHMLDNYGKHGPLLKRAKNEGFEPGFIDRFVNLLEAKFKTTSAPVRETLAALPVA